MIMWKVSEGKGLDEAGGLMYMWEKWHEDRNCVRIGVLVCDGVSGVTGWLEGSKERRKQVEGGIAEEQQKALIPPGGFVGSFSYFIMDMMVWV